MLQILNSNIVNNKGMKVCKSCGIVGGHVYGNGYIDFYEDMYKLKRKPIYNRKYYIENLIVKICKNNSIGVHNKNKIMAIYICGN